MTIDCDSCAVRGKACGDCAITALIGGAELAGPGPAGPGLAGPGLPGAGRAWRGHTGPELTGLDRRALNVLAGAGMIPPVRFSRRRTSFAAPPESKAS